MKTGKRIVSIFLVVLMLLTAAPLAGFVGLEIAPKAKAYEVGDHIQFGTYPQSQVAETPELRAAAEAATWRSYNYYSGNYTGNDSEESSSNKYPENGKMKPGNWMKFADFFCGDTKYRAVTFMFYRPSLTGNQLGAFETPQETNGYLVNHIYYFQYEPLTWRVLHPNSGYIMCESLIDAQAYQNYLYYGVRTYWYGHDDEGGLIYANNYVVSSIRAWLNYDFYETSFSESQKAAIQTTKLNNDCYNQYDPYSSAETNDKVFLLSYSDATNSIYGFKSSEFNSDPARQAQGTDYAKCQGLYVDTSDSYQGNSLWLLRTASVDSLYVSVADTEGKTNAFSFVDSTSKGIRPACKVSNLNSDITLSDSLFSELDSLKAENIEFDILEDKEKDEYVHGCIDSIYFNSNWFSQDAKQYNHELCQFCSQFAMLGYAKKEQLVHALEEVGFDVDNDYVNLHTNRDEVNYFIVSKEINVNNEPKTLIFAGFIGSYHEQWNSDFDPYGLHRKNDYAGDAEKGIVHLGFADARDFVLGRLNKFIRDNQIERSDIKLLLTGHSRGAATANLLAGKLIGKDLMVDSGNLYAYTFATPRGAQVDGMLTEKYGCIFNIVNPEDFVTKVLPYNWGFYRFGYGLKGSTYVLPSKTNEADNYSAYKKAMQSYYARFTSESKYSPFLDGEATVYKLVKKFTNNVKGLTGFYETKYTIDTMDYRYSLSSFSFFKDYICPFVNGTKKEDQPSTDTMIKGALLSDSPFSDFIKFFIYEEKVGGVTNNIVLDSYFSESHDMRTYCAYVMSMKESDMRYREGYEGTVNCPVDVEIIDKRTNEIVGCIVDNVVDEEIFAKENSVVMSVDGDEKSFWLPSNGDYEVKHTGNVSGKMDYTLAEIDSDIGELSRTNFFGVALENGLTYTSEVGGETFTLPGYTLTTEDGTEIQPDETFDAYNAIEYTVTVSADENGTAGSDGTYTSGDYATVNAFPNEGYVFDGWFVNDELISPDANYRFRVDADVTLTAHFKPCVHQYTETVITAPNCTASGESTFTCSVCGDTYTESIPALGHTDANNDGHCDRCGEQMTGGDHCKFCGKIHNGGFFDKLTGFFHKIFAIFKR